MATETVITRSAQGRFQKEPISRSELTGQQTEGQPQKIPQRTVPFIYEQLFTAAGGYAGNPMGFPGYEFGYFGTYDTYDWVLQHPVVRFVRSIVIAVIAASVWEYERRADTIPQEWADYVGLVFDPIRADIMKDFFADGRDMGWSGGEPIWDIVDGRYKIVRIKPLEQRNTDILVDPKGNFVGLKNHGGPKPVSIFGPYKAWKYSYGGKTTDHHGRSWLENIRATAWKDWLDCAQQLQRLGTKIAGTVTIITSPAGTFPGPLGADGKPTVVSYQENAEKVIKSLARGVAGVWFPSLGLAPDSRGSIDAMKVLVELVGKSLTNIDVKDFSGNSKAIEPILDRMKHDEDLIFNGGLRSARSGLEGEHGTKAEAGVHTDTGTLNAEMDDKDFAHQLQPLVDSVLVLNFGERARGAVTISPPSLVDRKTAILKALILALANIPEIAIQLATTTDLKAALEKLDVMVSGDFDSAAMIKRFNAKKQPQPGTKTNPEPQGGRPTEK